MIEEKKLSEKIADFEAGKYFVTAAIWRTLVEGHTYDTYEIGIRFKPTGGFTLLQSDKYDHQSVQEVANAIALLLSDETQSYDPKWCQRYFT
jgi:hypothetical protein